MLPKDDVLQYVHRGTEAQVKITIGAQWNTSGVASQNSLDEGFQKSRKMILDKFTYIPLTGSPTPPAIIIKVNGARGKFMSNGMQTGIWAVIDAQPGPSTNIPVIYQYQPFIVDWCDIGPYDTEVTISYTDDQDNEFNFANQYSMSFSISAGYV